MSFFDLDTLSRYDRSQTLSEGILGQTVEDTEL